MTALPRITCAAILAAATAAPAAPVQADESIPSKARQLAETGRSAHDAGDYARAIAAFKEAYVIAPAPALLFNLAQAYRLQGNCDDAQMMYRRYLASGPPPEGRALAMTHLNTVERCLRKRSLNIPMDDSMAYLQVPDPPKDLGIVDTPVEPRRLRRDVGLGLVFGGTAALSIAAYYAYRAHEAAQDVEQLYASGAKGRDIALRDADGQKSATAARMFGVGGGLMMATGITLVILDRRAHEKPRPAQARKPVPVITPTARGATAGVSWRF